MSSRLQLRLLGAFSFVFDGRQISGLSSLRLQSLLSYLALRRDIAESRQHLAALFWPDTTETQARSNLRQLVHQLRQALPEAETFIQVDATSLRWLSESPFTFDVADLEQACARAALAAKRHDSAAQQDALREADDLYRGPLLPNCFDDWIVPERERLQQCHLQILEQLVDLCELQGDFSAAIRYGQRLIKSDPLSEERYRRVMRLYVRNNDRAGALRVYHACAAALQSELGIEPDPATRAEYEQLLRLDRTPVPSAPRRPALAVRTTLVGRRREWEELQQAWSRVATGGPHFMLVTGEAGIGKSRLSEEFLSWAGQQGAITAKTRSYAAEGQLSLAPVTDWLRTDAIGSQLRQLEPIWLTEVARVLPELLAERLDVPHFEPVSEYGQRQRFFEALARAVLATPQSLVLLIDDLQWCDGETLEWLHFLLRFNPEARLLVIGCARAEELPPHHPLHTLVHHLNHAARATEMSLPPLDAAETAKLAAQVAGREWDVDELMFLFRETAGFPLFVVETVRARLGQVNVRTGSPESPGAMPSTEDDSALPSRVRAVLTNRIEQLSPAAREIAELAAVIGREFTLDLLVVAGRLDVDETVRALDELWRRRILREHGADSYDFTHDKLREVAYAGISVPQRRMLHHRIAQALALAHADDLDSVSGQLAYHYERGGLVKEALPEYQRAAAVAQRVYANEEAIALLARGLGLLQRLPAGYKRDQEELRLQLALAPLYRVTKGWAAPELEHVLERTLALCDTVGGDSERAQALYGLQSLYAVQSKLARVQLVSDDLRTLYQRSLGTVPPFADMMLAGAQLHLGRITAANEQFDQIIAKHDPDQILRIQESQGSNYAAHARAWQSHALWCLGYPQQAYERGLDAVQLVQALNQPFSEALVSAYLALLQQLRADDAEFRDWADAALELARKYRAPYYLAWSEILLSYALACERPDEAHIQRLRASISEFSASGARLRLPYYLSLLARIYADAGRLEDALAVLDEARAASRAHNERLWDSELLRLRGELLLASGTDAEEVEAALLRALEIARSQLARSFELRAAVSLARFWTDQQRRHEAKSLLDDVYSHFTEGFDTPDLRQARAFMSQM